MSVWISLTSSPRGELWLRNRCILAPMIAKSRWCILVCLAWGCGGRTAASDNCPASQLSLQVLQPPNANWCLGDPALCGYGIASIVGTSGDLLLSSDCVADCDTCTATRVWCGTMCIGPYELTSAGYPYTWDGTYLVSGTCGSPATSCLARQCAAPGHYQLKICGFPKPDPYSGLDCKTASNSTALTCTNFDFDYPATGTITFTMPVPVM
jgi:hypothetical protein